VTEREPVGVLGGTFDPIHLGHLSLAEAARDRMGLRRVWLVPCAVPPHKLPAHVTRAEHRAAMIALAILDRPGLELCDVELRTGTVQYTIDTLRALRGAPWNVNPVFLLGFDSLTELPTWRQPSALLEEFDLVVVDRPDDPRSAAPLAPEVSRAMAETPAAFGSVGLGRGGRVFRLPVPPAAISSRDIRARAAARASLAGLVPPSVARYIQHNGVYD
jgi:nicotinate-nucleotide adenylyltransferase